MPTFWAKDYLSEALQEQRAVVERMSLAPPAHIEIVDCYAHKGEVDNVHCSMPWIILSPDPDWTLHSHSSPASLLQTLGAGGRSPVGGHLRGLISGAGGPKVAVEKYGSEGSGSESLFSDDDEITTGASSSSLTQEIDLAVDRVMMSSVSSEGGRGHSSGCREDFPAENLLGWEKNTTTEVAELFFEEHETPPHLSSLLSALPTVSDLVARLKPKLISDPLINPSTGSHYTYIQVCRSDFEFWDKGEAPVINYPIIAARELDHFPREDTGDVTGDPVLEMVSPVTEPLLLGFSPSDPTSSSSLLPPLPQLPSPVLDHEEEHTLKSAREELSVLVSEVQEETERRREQQLHFPSPAPHGVASTTAEFLTLNSTDVSHDSEDSGIGQAVLESPCVTLFPSPSLFPSSSLPAQLAHLQPIPVSPNSPQKLDLLSPPSEGRLLAHLQADCRDFDGVLALKIPFTGKGSHLDAILKSYKPLQLVEGCCDVHPINFTGDSELALPWDPLASSYHLMTDAQRGMVCLQCPLRPDSAAADQIAEKYVADAGGCELEDSEMEEGDVPSMHAAPAGYLMKSKPAPLSSRPTIDATPRPLKSDRGRRAGERLPLTESVSPLELFIMMRTGKLSPEIANAYDSKNSTEVKGTGQKVGVDSQIKEERSWATSSTIQDVYLNREHQLVLAKVVHYGSSIVESLRAHGLPVSGETLCSSLDPDDVRFFLKQQQKCLADSQGTREESVLLQSCKLAACLYVLVSLADGITNISLTAGLRRFTFLKEKYEELIGSGLDAAKQGLADLQLRQQDMHHPKLHSLVSVVDTWKMNKRNTEEKAVVVLGEDFATVSGAILDFLKSISDLKSCVFSFACESPGNPLYLKTLEERLQYYDCLVIPLTSIVTSFPWEKVGLLLEYHPVGGALFSGGQLPDTLRLSQWLVLSTVRETAVTSLTKSVSAVSVMAFQYTLIASENITNNTKLLQLLEARLNIVLISREYEPLKKKIGTSFSHADLVVDHGTGVLVHRLSVLSTDAGVHRISARAAALSLQYQRLWILLYAEPEENYPYGGNVPLNLARLHASVAHYCPQQDDYQVKVLCVSDLQEAAQLVRTISEDTRKQSEGVNDQNWSDREWIPDDMNMHERFLLGFPCLNSFSALQMLRVCSLRQLLMLNSAQLQELFPWLPQKAVKFFTDMCNVSFQRNLPVLPPHGASRETSSHWQTSGGASFYTEAPTTISLDDSLQYITEEGYSPSTVTRGSDSGLQEQQLPQASNTATSLWSSGGVADVTAHPVTADRDTPAPFPADPGPVEGSESNFNPFTAHPSHRQSGEKFQDRELVHDAVTEPLPSTERENYSTKRAEPVTVASKSHFPPPHHLSLFEPHPTLGGSSPGRSESSASLAKVGNNHFALPDNLLREYYGNDPMPPRLLTSGMVRRTPNRRPIKSLDSDVGEPIPPRGRSQPRLQANDRAAALGNGAMCEESINSEHSVSGNVFDRPGRWARVQGVEDLMAFHSRQSSVEGERARAPPFSDTTLGATITRSQRFRQKRPLPSSPIFDCRVPTPAISPQSGGESSLFPSPNISFGSVKLSPLRKRRLIYKKLPSSLDGQTKLAFE